ncbi:MAG: hypothetical protein MJ142_00055 [Clostridia bacterium]|nr:hypothetical protein [Clostridia bacterium]
MKKLIALLLAVLMLAGTAFAEDAAVKTAVKTQTVESVSGLLTFEVPSRWYVMKPGTVDELFTVAGDAAFDEMGLTEADIANAKAAISQVDLSQMDMVYTASMTGNLNVIAQEAAGMNMSLLKLMKSVYDQMFAGQYMNMGVPEESIIYYDIEQIGDLEWYRMDVEYAGNEICQFITCDQNSHMIIFTFTRISEPDFMPVLESVKLI